METIKNDTNNLVVIPEEQISKYQKITLTEKTKVGSVMFDAGTTLFVEIRVDPKYPMELNKTRRDAIFDIYMKAYRKKHPNLKLKHTLDPETEQKYYNNFLDMSLNEIYSFIDNTLAGNR